MGIFSYQKKKAYQSYASDPANFAYGQGKVWEELSPVEKASSLFQQKSKGAAKVINDVGTQALKAGGETLTALGDVASRISPIEPLRNTVSGVQEVMKGTPGVPAALAYEKGVQESKARPLMFEKLTGENLKNPDGTVNWDFARKFVGRAMEGPTYAYAGGAVPATELAGKGLLARILTRSVRTLPEAGVNTALQQGEQGNTENLTQNFLANALLMSGVSNVVGEIKLPGELVNKTVSDIEGEVGRLTPDQKVDIQDALRQGVKSDEILTNLQKIKENQVTPEEVAQIVNHQVETSKTVSGTPESSPIQEAGKTSPELSDRIGVAKQAIEIQKKTRIPSAQQDQIIYRGPGGRLTVVDRDAYEGTKDYTGALLPKPDTVRGEVVAVVKKDGTVTDIYNKAQGGELSPETGKVAKAASDINKRITEKGFDELPEDELAKYTPVVRKQQVEAVSAVLDDWEKAQKMGLGKEKIPNNIDPQILYNAVKNKAESDGNIELMRQLASSPIATERSILAQKLGAAGVNNNPDSAVANMTELAKVKEEAVAKRLKSGNVEKTRKEVTGKIKETITKALPKKEDWTSFVESIKCK